MERYIHRGWTPFPIPSSGSQGVPLLAPHHKLYHQRRPRRLWSAAYPWLDSWFSGLCLNLTAWFSYNVVSFQLHTCLTGLPWRTAILLFTYHNVRACQSARIHEERTENHCHMLYNKVVFMILKNHEHFFFYCVIIHSVEYFNLFFITFLFINLLYLHNSNFFTNFNSYSSLCGIGIFFTELLKLTLCKFLCFWLLFQLKMVQ